jgi:hypothetical protein
VVNKKRKLAEKTTIFTWRCLDMSKEKRLAVKQVSSLAASKKT